MSRTFDVFEVRFNLHGVLVGRVTYGGDGKLLSVASGALVPGEMELQGGVFLYQQGGMSRQPVPGLVDLQGRKIHLNERMKLGGYGFIATLGSDVTLWQSNDELIKTLMAPVEVDAAMVKKSIDAGSYDGVMGSVNVMMQYMQVQAQKLA